MVWWLCLCLLVHGSRPADYDHDHDHDRDLDQGIQPTDPAPTWMDPIARTADIPMTLPAGQVLLVDEAQQINICGTLPSLYGVRGRPQGISFTEYSSVCNLFGWGVANISYTDLSTISTLLQSCGQVKGGMWLNAVQGYTDTNCLIFSDRYAGNCEINGMLIPMDV